MLWTNIISDLNVAEIVRTFYKKRIAKDKSNRFRTEDVIKRKIDKLYFKRKDKDNSFNRWIGKKDIVI